MHNPEVKIEELTDAVVATKWPLIETGSDRLDGVVSGTIGMIRERADAAYLLTWEGSKIPRGAVVEGQEITWTQHGVVRSQGRMIGTYDRLVEFGGDNGQLQQMAVYLNRKMFSDDS